MNIIIIWMKLLLMKLLLLWLINYSKVVQWNKKWWYEWNDNDEMI